MKFLPLDGSFQPFSKRPFEVVPKQVLVSFADAYEAINNVIRATDLYRLILVILRTYVKLT